MRKQEDCAAAPWFLRVEELGRRDEDTEWCGKEEGEPAEGLGELCVCSWKSLRF